MAYCGAIGSVNVLEFMSTDLFDEAQENPFLLAPASARSPTTHPTATGAPGVGFSGELDASSPGPSPASFRGSRTNAKRFELPLHDPQETQLRQHHLMQQHHPQHPHALLYPQLIQQQQQHQPHQLQQVMVQQPTPASPPSSPTSRASVTFNLPKSILKRQSSYESDASTAPSDNAEAMEAGVNVNETELHKLLYSLARFSVASETSTASSPEYQQKERQQRQHSVSQPTSPNPAYSSNTSSLWLRGSSQSHESSPHSPSSAGESSDRYMQQCHSTGRAALKSRQSRKTKPRSKSVDRAGYDTDPGEYDDDDDFGDDGFEDSTAARSRGSVSFQTVKNLLRGGGGGGRASRIVKRAAPDLRDKSTGTVSSRLKVRQKFARPTILTDAYHRVSTMKLGTNPMPAKVKHLAFPESFDSEAAEREADPGMPSPKGQLRATSLVMFDTLDKIGTRAACPVHLIAEESPDYTNVPARVDSHNRIVRVKQGLRRPSAWLMS